MPMKPTFLWQSSTQARKTQRLTFWVWRPPGGVGVFHAKGRWLQSLGPPSKVCLGFRREESRMSREFCRDVPDPWGCLKSLCKNICAHFSSLSYNGSEVPAGQNRQTITKARQEWVFCHWLVVAQNWVQSGFRGLCFTKSAPKPTLDSLLGHFQPITRNSFLSNFIVCFHLFCSLASVLPRPSCFTIRASFRNSIFRPWPTVTITIHSDLLSVVLFSSGSFFTPITPKSANFVFWTLVRLRNPPTW